MKYIYQCEPGLLKAAILLLYVNVVVDYHSLLINLFVIISAHIIIMENFAMY